MEYGSQSCLRKKNPINLRYPINGGLKVQGGKPLSRGWVDKVGVRNSVGQGDSKGSAPGFVVHCLFGRVRRGDSTTGWCVRYSYFRYST